MPHTITKLCYNPISGICESYTVDGEISCSELGAGKECATEGSYIPPEPPDRPTQEGLCYAIQSIGSTQVRWTNLEGLAIQAEIPQNTKVYLCSSTLPVEVNQADLEITQCGTTCNQNHNTVLDMYLIPCNVGVIGQGICSEGGTPLSPPGPPVPPAPPPPPPVSSAELSSAFTWEFDTLVEPETYRRFTTDTLPTYTLNLTNLSDQFYIKAFNSDSSPYILATNLKDNTQFSNTNGILLAPLESKKISVSFATEQINNQFTEQPRLGFRLEALKLIPTPT